MSYQACGVLGSGDPPPPLRIEPRLNAVAFVASMAFFSIWVIWPIFSSTVIWESNAATPASTDWVASIQGRPEGGDPDIVALGTPEILCVPVVVELPQPGATRTATMTAPRRSSR